MSVYGVLLCFALLPGVGYAAEFGSPITTVYSADDIGADPMGWVIIQDNDGVVHFGCNGLVSFDGDRWRTSPVGDSYALRGLDLAPGGRLWAAAVNEIGWYETDSSGSWSYHSLRNQLPETCRDLKEVWNAFNIDSGAVFVSQDRVLWWNGRTFTISTFPGSRRLSAMRVGRSIYVQHNQRGLFRVDRGSIELEIEGKSLDGVGILWMEPDHDEGWLLVTTKGLFRYRKTELRPIAPNVSAFVSANRPTCAVRLRDGKLAIGTLKGGIAIVSESVDRLEHRLGIGAGLPTNEIFSLACDREGGLWITSASCIIRASLASSALLFDRNNGLPGGPYLEFAEYGDNIVAATDERIFTFNWKKREIQTLSGNPGHIWSLQASSEGVLVAGNSGIDLLSEGGFRNIFRSEQDVFAVAVSSRAPRTFWVAAGRQLLQYDQASGRHRLMVPELPDIVTSISEDVNHCLWCGTTNAGVLTVLDEPGTKRARLVGTAPGLPTKIGQVAVCQTKEGTILALSQTGGWYFDRVDGHFKSIVAYPQRRLAAYSIPSERGVAWLVHPSQGRLPACIAAVRIHNGVGYWVPYLAEGLSRIGGPTSLLAKRFGSKWALWVGGTVGILRVEVNQDRPRANLRAPLITVLATGPSLIGYRLVNSAVPYSMHDIKMEFALPEYSRRASVRLETLLQGIDRGWIPVGISSDRELPALSDGEYRVLARAVDADGQSSMITTRSFTILPPFWRSLPVQLALSLIVVSVGFLIFQWRNRFMRARTKMLEGIIETRTEQINQANQAKTDFIASISHDIRNPLNGLIGMTIALEDTKLNKRQRQILTIMRGCGDYVAALMDNVIDFAKIEAGRIELKLSVVEIRVVMEEVVAILRGCAESDVKNVALSISPDLPPAIVTDGSRLKEILVNYAINAFKHAGGPIRLTAQRYLSNPNEIEFSVEDNGRGFTTEEKAVLFTRFGRLNEQGFEAKEGSGIGLFACRRLAEAMGGRVGIESDLGNGARFYVRIPFLAGHVSESLELEKLPAARVLLVEDTDYNAWATSAVLSRLGLAISARARSGCEALEILDREQFDLILLDRNLPDMDGNEVARQFRRCGKRGTEAKIVAVTAYSTVGDMTASLNSGMDAFVGKPLTPQKLRTAILKAGVAKGASFLHCQSETLQDGFKRSIFRELSDGSQMGYRREKERYLANLTAETAELREALRARDLAAVRTLAHRLLAAAKLVEALDLSQAAEELERVAGTSAFNLVFRLGNLTVKAAVKLNVMLAAEDSRSVLG